MLSEAIGPQLARTAVDLHRAGQSAEKIHAALWPHGSAALTPAALDTLLRADALAGEDDAALPRAELPKDLEEAAIDLAAARAQLTGALVDEEGRPNVMAHAALTRNVDCAVKLHSFRLALEKHQTERFLEEEVRARESRARRLPRGRSQ